MSDFGQCTFLVCMSSKVSQAISKPGFHRVANVRRSHVILTIRNTHILSQQRSTQVEKIVRVSRIHHIAKNGTAQLPLIGF